jgi:hypothetical protein
MGYQLADGTPLALDVAFDTPDGVQRPANWLRLSTPRDRELAGITWVADVSSNYDQRFYWGVDNPKDLDSLKTLWKSEQNKIAGTLLASSDWRVIKAKETSTNIPSTWKTYRAAVRTACNTRQTEIDGCADVPALIELLFGAAQIAQDGEMVANPNLATAWPDPVE